MNFAGPFDAKLLSDSPVTLDGGGFAFGAKPGFVQHNPSDTHVVIPDAHLLFSGAYTRIGNDLIISGPDQKFVVGSYFKGESRPALSSKDGATLSGQIIDALTGHVHYAQAGATGTPAQVIGHVLKLTGSASVIRNGVSVELHVGDAVQKGDVVQTGSDSSIGMTFIDGAAFGMTSNARMVLNEMIYDPNGSSNSSLISLVQGTITFVAGQTAKNGNMRVETPVATMGIRGTAVLVEISANDGPTKFSVLVEPDGKTGSFNLYDKATGQLIGTVSQAGQVTFVSSLGIGQPPSAVEQLKTLADQQSEKFIVQQVFQLFFPNYTPDDAKPKSPNSNPRTDIGVPENIIGKYAFDPGTGRPTYTVVTPITNPDTHQTTNTQVTFYNIKAAFSTTGLSAKEESPDDLGSTGTVKLTDAVHIDDPDIGIGPFFDVATKFVAHSGTITSATTTADLTSGAKATLNLGSLLNINQTTGDVSFNRADFNFLAAGEKAEFIIRVTASSGPDSAQLFVKVTINGENDDPTIVHCTTDDQGSVKEEDIAPDTVNDLATSGKITFQDFDLTDGHQATFVLKSAISSEHLPGFVDGVVGEVAGVAGIGHFSLDQLVTEIRDDATNTGHVRWHFVLDNDNTTLQSLAEGQTITLVYTVTIDDLQGGLPAKQDIEITITGTNDAPKIVAGEVLQSATIYEIVGQTGGNQHDRTIEGDIPSGVIHFTDVDLVDRPTPLTTEQGITYLSADGEDDLTDSLTLLQRSAIENAFKLSVPTGPDVNTNHGVVNWTYELVDNVLDFLAEDETITLVSTVRISDGHGGYAEATVTINIVGGANDRPSVSGVTDIERIEQATALHETIAVDFTDVDLTETGHTASVVNVAVSGEVPPGTTQDETFTSTDPGAFFGLLTTTPVIKNAGSATGSTTFNFNAGPGVFDYLAEEETLTLTYTVAITDSHGAAGTQTITIVVTGTNDDPTITATSATLPEPDGHTGVPDTITATGTITFADVDLSDRPGIDAAFASFSYKDATGTDITTSLTSAQSLAVNALLTSLSIVPNGAYANNGSATWTYSIADATLDFLREGDTLTLTYTASVDDGNDGTAIAPITITITGTNDAPVINAHGGSLAYTENQAATVIASTVTVSDMDNVNLNGATVSISANFSAGEDVLGFTAQNGITGSYNTATGVLTLSGSASVADYEAALRSVTYVNSSDNPSSLPRTISYQVDDHQALNHSSDIVTATVSVAPVNDAPVLDLDSSDAPEVATGGAISLLNNGFPFPIGLNLPLLSPGIHVTITDADNTNMDGAKIVLTDGQAGDFLVPSGAGGVFPSGIVWTSSGTAGDAGDPLTITLSGSYSAADYAMAIGLIGFGTNGAAGDRHIEVTVNDGLADSNVAVAVASVAQAPAPDLPDSNLVWELSVTDDYATLQSYLLGFDPLLQGAVVRVSADGVTFVPVSNEVPTVVPGSFFDFSVASHGVMSGTPNSGFPAIADLLQAIEANELNATPLSQTLYYEIVYGNGAHQNASVQYNLSDISIHSDFAWVAPELGSTIAIGGVSITDWGAAIYGQSQLVATIQVTSGQLSIDQGEWGGDVTTDAFSHSVTITGTQDQINANLLHLQYTAPATQQLSLDSVKISVADGPTQSVSWVAHINPGGPSLNVDDAALSFDPDGTVHITGLSVSDANETGQMTAGISSYPGSAAVIQGGTIEHINDQLADGLTYTPSNPSEPGALYLTITDSGGLIHQTGFVFGNPANTPSSQVLSGSPINDVIFSSASNDTMTGLSGADNFVFAPSSGHDTITDFHAGSDHIVLNGYGDPFAGTTFNDWLNDNNHVEDTANGAVIHLDANDTITLTGVAKATLTANDFIIHPGIGV